MATMQQKRVSFSNVNTTEDYFLFKPIDGNRNKNLTHINRLRESIKAHYLFTVIIVNEKYEIIDGQHRFEVISELHLPLHYIICRGYGLQEVHILNQNSKTWDANDYLAGYCDLGYKEYLKYRDFKNKYGLGHHECQTILLGKSVNKRSKVFFDGSFKVANYSEACKTVELIFTIEPYYSGFKRRSFIYAMLILLKNPNFDFGEFMHKLKQQPTAMMDCVDQEQYVAMIEDLYNYRRKDKINLRY